MVKRFATALVAVAASATALAAVSPAAHADPTPTPSPSVAPPSPPDPQILSVSANPDPLVLKPRYGGTVTVFVRTKDIKDVKIDIAPGGGGYGGGYGAVKAADPWNPGPPDHKDHVWKTFDRSFNIGWKDPTGSWKIHVLALGLDGKEYSRDSYFSVKHIYYPPRPKTPKATRIVGFDASPEPVKKGRKLSLEGTLQVAQCYRDWYYNPAGYVSVLGGSDYCVDSRDYWNDWHYLGWQDIGVYFMPKGSYKWKYVDTIKTNPDGSFYTQVRAFVSGTWGVRFNGTRKLGASEGYDYVKVIGGKRH
ncbi:hypothetical protein J5X84_21720 [Streptosporangiaceae bacterium NEAU-GS5]|nr:hypothetical protein [Streptosporangiaceae bacterium NEAU-GS5]